MCLDEGDESIGGGIVRGDGAGTGKLGLDHRRELLAQLDTASEINILSTVTTSVPITSPTLAHSHTYLL